MPFCTECGKSPTTRGNNKRTINSTTKLCNECTAKSSANLGNSTTDGMNSYFEQYHQSLMNGEAASDESVLSEDMLTKSVSELTVKDILTINMHANKPIAERLDSFMGQVNSKVSNMDKRIEFLEAENRKKAEDNATLKEIIRNMQRSLNKSDSDVRNKNIIITSLPEGDIETDHKILKSDHENVSWILDFTKNESFSEEAIGNFQIDRLGEPKIGYNRVLKITLPSAEDRDAFLEEVKTLKNAPEPWSKVYVKKDQHPTYIAENNKLRKKMKLLKSNPDNQNKDIKILKGKLLVDNEEVDGNTFFP